MGREGRDEEEGEGLDRDKREDGYYLQISVRHSVNSFFSATKGHLVAGLGNLYTQCSRKKQPLCFLVITSANEHRFSQFFHCEIPQEIFYRYFIETSTSP